MITKIKNKNTNNDNHIAAKVPKPQAKRLRTGPSISPSMAKPVEAGTIKPLATTSAIKGQPNVSSIKPPKEQLAAAAAAQLPASSKETSSSSPNKSPSEAVAGAASPVATSGPESATAQTPVTLKRKPISSPTDIPDQAQAGAAHPVAHSGAKPARCAASVEDKSLKKTDLSPASTQTSLVTPPSKLTTPSPTSVKKSGAAAAAQTTPLAKRSVTTPSAPSASLQSQPVFQSYSHTAPIDIDDESSPIEVAPMEIDETPHQTASEGSASSTETTPGSAESLTARRVAAECARVDEILNDPQQKLIMLKAFSRLIETKPSGRCNVPKAVADAAASNETKDDAFRAFVVLRDQLGSDRSSLKAVQEGFVKKVQQIITSTQEKGLKTVGGFYTEQEMKLKLEWDQMLICIISSSVSK